MKKIKSRTKEELSKDLSKIFEEYSRLVIAEKIRRGMRNKKLLKLSTLVN